MVGRVEAGMTAPIPKHTPEARQVILAAVAAGMSKRDAAGLAGIHRATLHRWEQQDATLSDELTQARGRAILENLNVIRTAAKGRAAQYDAQRNLLVSEIEADWRAAAWLLPRLSEDFREKVTIDVMSAVATVAEANGLDKDEVFAELEDLLANAG